jgi:ubiquinone/menaquinone biosynthesis C-methylase UbiE
MADPVKDKQIEFERYDRRASDILGQGLRNLEPDGALGIDAPLRAPYLTYERAIISRLRRNSRVLDVCCGNGLHSLTAARHGAHVTVSDLAPQNVAVAIARGARAGLKLAGVAADAEKLPFPAHAFDLVTCAGSLSYVDLDRFIAEVCRVLTPTGSFICVDSLNHNPIYRFNRYLRHLRGERSLSVITRTPTLQVIRRLAQIFPDLQEVRYHGTFSFVIPALRPFLGSATTARMLDRLDLPWKLVQRLSFKFVFAGTMRPGDSALVPHSKR